MMPSRWRTGRKVGRTIYLQHGAEPSDSDILIGVMDFPDYAKAAVDAYNATIDPGIKVDAAREDR